MTIPSSLSGKTTQTMNRRRSNRPLLSALLALLAIPASLVLWGQTNPDTDPPQIHVLESGAELADGRLFNRAAAPVIQVIDASAVTVDVRLDGAAFSSGTSVAAEGSHLLAVTATDVAGNTAAVSLGFQIDTTPPTVAILQPAAGAVVKDAAVDVVGSAQDTRLAGVTVNGIAATVNGSNWLAPHVPLAEGSNTLTAHAEDRAGNAAETSRTVVRDSQPPALAVTDPASGTVVPGSTLTLHGTAGDPHLDRVEVNGVRAHLSAGAWSLDVTLHEGNNDFAIQAFDTLGNAAAAALSVIRDSQAPAVQIDQPADGSRLRAATVAVSGTVAQKPGLAVTVNGVAATVTGGSFSAPSISLVEGENTLTVRARDSLGNEGVATRKVVRDTVAPSLGAADPAAGALALPVDAVFRLTFSEPMATTASGNWRLETGAGQAIAATASVTGEQLTVRPSALLPSSAQVRLVLTAGLTDLAGNPLASPPTLAWFTADTAAPAAPVFSPAPPATLCANTLTLAGTAEAGAIVRVQGGAAAAEGRADETGYFSIPVQLVPEGINLLRLTAADSAGNLSDEAITQVIADCQPPRILSAAKQGSAFRIAFSEPVAASTVGQAVHLSSSQGAMAGSVSVAADGRSATFTPSGTLPAGALRLDVSTEVRDLAGNALAYPWSQVFGADFGDGFLSGTVIDDATGRPLAGARVVLFATDGTERPEPKPEQVTGPDGRFRLPAPAGMHELTIARSGYTPSFRVVATNAGQGIDVFDPRLTPAAPAKTVGAAGGAVGSGPDPVLTLPSGALSASTTVTVTGLSEQGIPAALPFGWSPRGAAWVDLDGRALLAPATLSLPVEAADGTNLALVRLDLASLQWRVLGTGQAAGGRVSIPLPAAGAGLTDGGYAALEADDGSTTPPAPVTGAALGGSPRPSGNDVTAATLGFDPQVVLPSQTSLATASYTTTQEVASGLPLTLEVAESLTLLDGSVRRQTPYQADLVLYRAPDGAARSRFRLRPSQDARSLPLELGAEDAVLRTYGESVAGNVVGPEGGTITDEQGDRVDLPAGALTEPAAVTLTRKVAQDLPIALPAGTALSGVVDLDLGGRSLLAPAALSLALSPAPSVGDRGLLLEVVDLGSGAAWRPVATLQATATGWTTAAIDAADLPWPGAREEGLYAFVRLTGAFGYLRGTVFDVDAAALPGALLRGAGWVQIAGADGRYVLPAPVGAVSLTAENRATGNLGGAGATIAAADARVDLDVTLAVSGPRVLQITPADGAVDVPQGVEPTVRFSEPVDPSSAIAGIQLLEGGTRVTVTLDVQGTLVRLSPRSALLPGTAYELRVGTGVRDLQGNPLDAPAASHFTTRQVVAADGLDLAKVFLVEPDANGQAHVIGRAGAVPAGALVFAENRSALANTPSVDAAADGSFSLALQATLNHRLVLHVLVTGRNEVVAELTPFHTADLKGAWVGAKEITFTTGDGIAVRVPEGAFSGPTRVRVEPRPLTPPASPVPSGLAPVYDFNLDFGGAGARKALQISVPNPAGAPEAVDGLYLLNRVIVLQGKTYWMMHDLMRLDAASNRLTTELPPATQVASLADPFLFAAAPAVLTPKAIVRQYKSYVCGSAFPGQYEVVASRIDLGFTLFPSFDMNTPVGIWNLGMEGMATSLNRSVAQLLDGDAVLIPTRRHQPYTLVVRDLSTGFKLSQQTYPPVETDDFVPLPPDVYGNKTPPAPASGSPVRFFPLNFSGASEQELATGIKARLEGTEITVTGEADSTQSKVQIRLIGLDDGTDATATSDESGAFNLDASGRAEKRYLLAVGARIPSEKPLDVTFSEALQEGFPGIDVADAAGNALHPKKDPVDTRATVRIRLETGWRAGEHYTLRLNRELADASGNEWDHELDVQFEVAGSDNLGTFNLPAVRDVARLGSWLFVAADTTGLMVLDAEDPAHLKNVLPGNLAFPFPLADAVRGVTVDPHGRVLVAGGGNTGPGQLKIFDPLALDVAAITAHPDDLNVRYAAFKGSTIVSDKLGGTGTQLPSGLPRRVAVLSNDQADEWKLGEEAPNGINVSQAAPSTGTDGAPLPDFDVTVSGTGVTPGRPVTLQDVTLGRWQRVDADANGHWSVTLSVQKDDRLALLRNHDSTAYVATTGVGLEVVDVNAFYNEDHNFVQSDILGTYSGFKAGLELCGQPVADIGTAFLDMDTLFDPANLNPIVLVGLVGQRGFILLRSNPASVGDVSLLNSECTEVEGSTSISALAVLQRYGFDLDEDGKIDSSETGDYVLVAHQKGGVLVYDVTDREDIKLVGRIRMPGQVSQLSVDREGRRLYVAGAAAGVYVVDLDAPPSVDLVDENGDGKDDRILETVTLPGNTNANLHLIPELGLGLAGGVNRGLTTLAVGHPLVEALVRDDEGRLQSVDEVAPFGVPSGEAEGPSEASAAAGDSNGAPPRRGSFRIQASLPARAGDSPRLKVGEPNASCLTEELPTELDVPLHRAAGRPFEPGHLRYISDEIAVLADPRASRKYDRTSRENDKCIRCKQDDEKVPESAKELLSSDFVRVRFPEELRQQLKDVYKSDRFDASERRLKSVRWDTVPAEEQEARHHAGFADEAPGLLGNSGEMTSSSTDISLRGRGLDFVLHRTYRSQTIGAGAFGPGWDFNYNQRLRELPNGDVELFDGSGARETFQKQQQNGTLKAPKGLFATLERVGSGWVMIDAHHTTTRFDAQGRLTSIADAVKDSKDTGNELTFHYDAQGRLVRVHDTTDRDILFERRPDGQGCGEIKKITDSDGREFTYEYDDKNRLVSFKTPAVVTVLGVGDDLVTQNNPLETTYAYDSGTGNLAQVLGQRDNLTSVKDPKGQDWMHVTYGDAHGENRRNDVTSQTWGGGNIQVEYDFSAHTSKVTDPRGQKFSYTYDGQGQVKEVKDPANGVVSYTHDDEGLVTSRTDAYGRVTTYQYDAPCGGGQASGERRSRGNLTRVVVTPDGRGPNGSTAPLVTCTDYEGYSNQPVLVVDPRGVRTVISRNEVGLPIAVTQAAGTPEASTVQTSYNEHGQPVQVIDPNGHATQYTYNQNGYPSGMVVDSYGAVLVTHFNADGRGNVVSITDPRGVTFTRSFNALDWLTETRRAVTAPLDNDSAPALNYATSYFHDLNGNVVEEFLPYGDGTQSTRRAYVYDQVDELLLSFEQASPGQPFSEWITTARTYDLNRNLIRLVEPEGQTTVYTYDSRNYLSTVTRGVSAEHPEQQVVEHFGFDLEGKRVSYTDGRGGVWTTAYDGYGRVNKTTDALGNTATVTYDDASNPVVTGVSQAPEQAGGDATLLAQKLAEYDRLNRPKAITQKLWLGSAGGGRDVTSRFEYDAASNLVKIIDPLNRETLSEFDGAERLVASVDPAGNRTELTLDKTGNPVASKTIQVPSGRTVTVTSTYDALGRLATAKDGLNNTQKIFYDARNNPRLSIDAESFVTERTYDGMDRLTREVKPEGISVDYAYDKSSRLLSYKDALNQETTYTYDPLNRRTAVEYPDHTRETYEYDAGSNPTKVTDANGNVINQTFDAGNRLISRSVGRGSGVIGPVSELYAYDGLNRMIRAESGSVVTQLTFDSLSRLVHERNNGRDVDYQLDDMGNPTRIDYPSGFALRQTFDVLDRTTLIERMNGSASTGNVAGFTYDGPGLLATRTLANGLTGTRQYDAANRLLDETMKAATGQTVFRESLAWTPRSLRAGQSRGDLSGQGMLFAYDGAQRLVQAVKTVNPTLANNAAVPAQDLAHLADAFAYAYDQAQNLLTRTKKESGVPETVALPLDGSKRNRPGAVGSESLTWDANGNLTRKGDLKLEYDYRNRLTRVSRISSGQEVATYQYDTFNRRIAKTAGGETRETVWRGWQPIEEYRGTQLDQRRVYGLDLDDIVQLQTDFSSGGQPGQTYAPLYDSTGNLVVMTGNNGKPVERYEYTPYGERKIFVDDTPPAVEQVRVKGNALWVELSEGISSEALAQALTEHPAKLTVLGETPHDLDVAVTLPVTVGREANRRLVITTTGTAPAAQSQIRLTLPAEALQDSFLNHPAQDVQITLTWPESDAVVQDAKAIQLQRVTVREGYLEIELSEEPDLATTTAIQLDGNAVALTLGEDRYTLKSTNTLAAGPHTLAVGATLADLNGGALAQPFSTSVTLADKDSQSFFEAADPRETPASTIGNLFGFQGLPVDPETGLVYFRNRYYDPEMGRFVTVDPKGYIDGPSVYAFEGNDPSNETDPMGLCKDGWVDCVIDNIVEFFSEQPKKGTQHVKEGGEEVQKGGKVFDDTVGRSHRTPELEDVNYPDEWNDAVDTMTRKSNRKAVGEVTEHTAKAGGHFVKATGYYLDAVQRAQIAKDAYELAAAAGKSLLERRAAAQFAVENAERDAAAKAAAGQPITPPGSPRKTRFVVEPNGTAVDTDATPRGRYRQPNGDLTDILQKEDHGAGHSHTHEVEVHRNPKDPSKGVTKKTDRKHPVTKEEVDNIKDGNAPKTPPKGRG